MSSEVQKQVKVFLVPSQANNKLQLCLRVLINYLIGDVYTTVSFHINALVLTFSLKRICRIHATELHYMYRMCVFSTFYCKIIVDVNPSILSVSLTSRMNDEVFESFHAI